jgi:hypothetical protein
VANKYFTEQGQNIMHYPVPAPEDAPPAPAAPAASPSP